MRVDPITWLSKGTVNFIAKHDLINQVFYESDYIFIQKLIKKFRNKNVVINENHIRQLCENGAMAVYGEVFKYLIVLILAYFLGIFKTTFVIMNVFTALRALAGGVHMSSFNKCFLTMIVFFLSLGYLATHFNISVSTIVIGYMLSFLFAYKYAPQERPDKSDKDCDNGNKKKHKTMLFVLISFILSLSLRSNHTLISTSIFLGVCLEIITVTPIGIRFFSWLDRGQLHD